MIASAIAYGIFTLVSLWLGAGASSAELAARTTIAAAIFLLLTLATTQLIKIPGESDLQRNPLRWGTRKSAGAAVLALLGSLALFVSLQICCADYLRAQSSAIIGLDHLAATLLLLCLGLSAFVYHRYFAPLWGPASAAFLEALTWGLALQSFVAFVWIFATGYLLNRATNSEHAIGAVGIRLVAGLAWILLT